jgi:hypothetical protein
MYLNLQEVRVLWRVSGHCDSNVDILVLQHHQSEGGMNNIATKDYQGAVERVYESFIQSPR